MEKLKNRKAKKHAQSHRVRKEPRQPDFRIYSLKVCLFDVDLLFWGDFLSSWSLKQCILQGKVTQTISEILMWVGLPKQDKEAITHKVKDRQLKTFR